MPAPRDDIDRDALCTSIALHGPRETHRRTGVPLGTLARIAKAAGVKSPDHLTRTVPITAVRRTDDTEGAVRIGTPSHAIVSDEVSANGSGGRLYASRIGHDQLKAISNTMTADPSENALAVDSALTAAKLLQTSNVPGFERQAQAPTVGVVNIALLGQQLPHRTETDSVADC